MPQSRVPVGPTSLIVELARLIRKDFGERAEHLDLTQSQWRALYQISHHPGISQVKLAEKLEVHPVSVTQLVDRLVKSGWVIREPDPMDRRAVVTEVIRYDPDRIQQAIIRELNRDGQIFFVHNRVHDIHSVADDVRRLAPDARILVGHGRRHDAASLIRVVRHLHPGFEGVGGIGVGSEL